MIYRDKVWQDKRPQYLKPIAPWHVAQLINELNLLDRAIEYAVRVGFICQARQYQENQRAVIADLLNGEIEA